MSACLALAYWYYVCRLKISVPFLKQRCSGIEQVGAVIPTHNTTGPVRQLQIYRLLTLC